MIEVEKKFRLTKRQRDAVLKRLPEVGASLQGEEFEENTLYDGEALKSGTCVLRIRRVAGNATLTYKKRIPSSSAIKQQREEESVYVSVSLPDEGEHADGSPQIFTGKAVYRALTLRTPKGAFSPDSAAQSIALGAPILNRVGRKCEGG